MCDFGFDWNSITGEDDVLLHESTRSKPCSLADWLLSSGNALFGLLVETECTEANDCFRGIEMVGCWVRLFVSNVLKLEQSLEELTGNIRRSRS
jgi:hypothetical protein